MWGWGAMNAGAITEAVKTKYPMNQFVGIWWSGLDGDLKLVGEARARATAPVVELPELESPSHAGHQELCRRRRASR
jgi:branched-chain amino acid transport system substrate-binding protein